MLLNLDVHFRLSDPLQFRANTHITGPASRTLPRAASLHSRNTPLLLFFGLGLRLRWWLRIPERGVGCGDFRRGVAQLRQPSADDDLGTDDAIGRYDVEIPVTSVAQQIRE